MTQQEWEKTLNQEEKNFLHFDKINQFMSDLEIGDLATRFLISYGFVLYGMTRVGKTATSHLLAGNPLKGFWKNGSNMVDVTISKNSKAKIGNTMNSQTVVPNMFELKNYKVNNQPACVIDTPGYGDNKGILKILANGFFHFRLYSKIKNMKFLICFDFIHLKNTFKEVVETIIQFTKSFKNYSDIKDNIWESSCFVITKVEDEDSLQTIKEKFQSLVNSLNTQQRAQTQRLIKQFIQYMIDEDKIFIIKKYRNGQSSNDANLLQMIDKKVKNWWSREINPEKPEQVDMNDVVFALGKDVVVQTTASQVSQEQFAQLVKLYNLRISELMGEKSLMKLVLGQLVKDALGNPNSHNFLKLLEKYVLKYYPKSKKGQREDCYKEDREKEQQKLFQTSLNLSSSGQNRESRESGHLNSRLKAKNYPIKKMNALKRIKELMQKINEKEYIDRDIVWLEQCQVILFQIVKELAKVAYNKKDRKNIIYRFGYIVRRIVEEAKVFVLLLEKFSTHSLKLSIKQKSNNKVIQLFRTLKDFMGIDFSYKDMTNLQYDHLHEIYAQNFDPQNEENKNLDITEQFVDFFSQVKVQDNNTKLKIAKIILKYSTETLNDKTRNISYKEQCKLVQKLTNTINSCHELHLLFEQKKDKDKVLILTRKLGKNLGRVLQEMKKYELSRKVYDSNYFVDSVCKIYRLEIDQLDNSSQNSLQTRIYFCKYLMNHLRETDAIKLLQQTFQMAQQIEQLDIIRQQLSELMVNVKDIKLKEPTQYEKDIFDQVYFQKLDQQTLIELKKLFIVDKKQQVPKNKQISKISSQIQLEDQFVDVEPEN